MIYHHTCRTCNQTTELDMELADYEKLEEQYGLSEKGNCRLPCDVEGCDGWSERDYSFGVAFGIVKGGYKYTYNKNYRAGAEEEWMRNEVSNSRRINQRGGSSTVRPYTNYRLTNPEAAGFKKTDMDTAKQRADAAKKTVGNKWENVQNARKK